jgi:hypothetical protein
MENPSIGFIGGTTRKFMPRYIKSSFFVLAELRALRAENSSHPQALWISAQVTPGKAWYMGPSPVCLKYGQTKISL